MRSVLTYHCVLVCAASIRSELYAMSRICTNPDADRMSREVAHEA